MKESKPEAEWLPTLGWFYDLIAEKIISEFGGNVVKYLKDGAMASFDSDHVAEAINSAICLQEALVEARNDNLIYSFASVGLATGRVIQYKSFKDQEDYAGTVVDLAELLCSAASPRAILVDTETIVHANMGKVISKVGRYCEQPRTAKEYIGEEYSFEARGFNKLIRYHQILWGNHPYGLKPEFVETLHNSDTSTRGNPKKETPPSTNTKPTKERSSEITTDQVLREIRELWNIDNREDAINLAFTLSKSGNSEADYLIFKMGKTLFDESLAEKNQKKLGLSIELIKYAASQGNHDAYDMIEDLSKYYR
jgi:hypothetical protein